ncbi:hypothetical protein DM860_017758 [Cuscuta australis]|uniref:Uncharacterized protein n=1 Tax=Cuscuta australis TaxID=267555 RepID=A0A328DA64_9ASTE|nr:hypothetical protein DM860_017758 [Cuscuta australis]
MKNTVSKATRFFNDNKKSKEEDNVVVEELGGFGHSLLHSDQEEKWVKRRMCIEDDEDIAYGYGANARNCLVP